MYPRLVHSLQGIQQPTKVFGLHHHDKPYVIGFLRAQEAVYATRHTTLESKASLVRFEPKDVTDVIHSGLQQLGVTANTERILLDENALLKVRKLPSPLFEWMLQTQSLGTFLDYPFAKHVGVILVKRKIQEDEDALYYEVDALEPSFDPQTFVNHLNRLW